MNRLDGKVAMISGVSRRTQVKSELIHLRYIDATTRLSESLLHPSVVTEAP